MTGQAKLLDPFRDNLYRRSVDGATGLSVVEKSCPKCSKKAGVTTYYPETDFEKRSGARDGRIRDCKKHHKPARSASAVEADTQAVPGQPQG